jgi:hypothetical protein
LWMAITASKKLSMMRQSKRLNAGLYAHDEQAALRGSLFFARH